MILEGIVTTMNASGEVNIAPMGPRLLPPYELDIGTIFELRPFQTSQTYANLTSHPQGVLHVVDDVLLLAQAAVSKVELRSPLRFAECVRGMVLPSACRAYEFELAAVDKRNERAVLSARVVCVHRLRDFFGLNRAMFAVVEAAILATRLHLLPREEIMAEYARLRVLVQKTGGEREHAAFAFLEQYVGESA